LRFETFEDFSLGTLDEGGVLVLVFTVENDLRPIGVGVSDAAPGADGIGVLRVGL